ncbi:MAG: bis(5'-nucleosyl)-tetraphosphatase (symmetrical) YqeK [Clostridia bacterium]|nr:bis(5'-nucleosyl)-tetraphosphatase (symmetrical) YqeK [Clostridia bacterium]
MITEAMLDSLRIDIQKNMGKHRFAHTLGVEREMRRLAEIYMPQKVEKAAAAGLLHDVTKHFSAQEQIAYCRQNGIIISPEEEAAAQILHAKTAAHYIQKRYPSFCDEELVSAVAKHTTGNREMSLLDTMLYIADFMEEGRTYSSCRELRHMFWSGLPQAADKQLFLKQMLLQAYQFSLEALSRCQAVISPETVLARDALLAELS